MLHLQVRDIIDMNYSCYSTFLISFLCADWLIIVGVVAAVGAILLVCAAVAKRKR